jgi:hypothetical protein
VEGRRKKYYAHQGTVLDTALDNFLDARHVCSGFAKNSFTLSLTSCYSLSIKNKSPEHKPTFLTHNILHPNILVCHAKLCCNADYSTSYVEILCLYFVCIVFVILRYCVCNFCVMYCFERVCVILCFLCIV